MKVAILWLINEKGELLLAKRASTMESDAGVWGTSVAGRIKDNETPLAAIVREAKEELGLSSNRITPIFLHEDKHNHQDGEIREFSVFYARVNTNFINDLTLDPNEVEEVRWFSIKELKALIRKKSDTLIISSDTRLWNNLFKHIRTLLP
jgi:8-oxo-dGTP pyrophosphatase MutT (NUDIX family)